MIKRLFDLLVSGAALLVLSPLFLVAAILIRLDSGGPVIFKQRRAGLRGKDFFILKFRTMVTDASARGGLLTTGRDQRITGAGKWLRASKIDELPQLWNVFAGEMSFVGPRPEVPEFVAKFSDDYKEILKVRPGITDFASIKYRREAEILAESENPEAYYLQEILPDKIRLAKDYVARASFILDLQIILTTLRKVLCS